MVMWTSDDVQKATGGAVSLPFTATGVSIDTRTLKKGELYVAIKGDSLDGHAYVEEAFKQGASAALVRADFTGAEGKPLVRVPDTFRALQDLGVASRARSKARIVAVTGSAGKTGTKELLAIALGALGQTHASRKSFNNHWGVPLSLANMPAEAEFGVFEIGMNHAGEIRGLVQQVRPHVAVITTVEPIHLEHFENVEAIADAKAEIFTAMDAGGIAVLNVDNPHYQRLKQAAEACGVQHVVTFGEDEKADSRLKDCLLRSDGIKARASILGEAVELKVNIPGKHIALNALSVLTVVKLLGGDIRRAASALRKSEPVEGRGNRIEVTLEKGAAPLVLIDESYNANPASMRAAFSVFEMVEPQEGGRRIAVLGDMLELGANGPAMHVELANPLLKAKADKVFCCGPLMEALYNVLPPEWQGGYAKNSQVLAPLVADAVRPGDVVLIKGSNGSKMSYVLQALRHIEEKGQVHAV